MNLWPHQSRAIRETTDAIGAGEQRICVTSPTGGGKTLVICELVEQYADKGCDVVLYTNRRLLIEQLSTVLAKHGIRFGIRAAGHPDQREKQVQISSLPTERSRLKAASDMKQWELHGSGKNGLAIVDECFVAGTLVTTQDGEKPIESVRPGDMVFCACGLGEVENVSKRLASDIWRLDFDNGSHLECTANHRIFTSNGWKTVAGLAKGTITFGIQSMSGMWPRFSSQENYRPGRTNTYFDGIQLDQAKVLLDILLQEARKCDGRSDSTREDAANDFESWSQAENTRRQWSADASTTKRIVASAGCGVVYRIRCEDRSQERQRLSDCLQDRHSLPREEDRYRGRRPLPRRSDSPSAGSEEGRSIGHARVVSVSCIKRACPVPVYNLQVSRHPSYFANGHLVHNCHLNATGSAETIINRHVELGHAVVGFTATPIDLAHLYSRLIVAGTQSELRACGALVAAYHYGPDEPDMKGFKQAVKTGEYSEGDVKKAIMTPCIFSRVLENWNALNPERYPAILFAPGVAESIWFAEQFHSRGLQAAHIDGEGIWRDGSYSRGGDRNKLLGDVRTGEISVLCNRFVLREGLDLPEVSHLILATVMGGLQTYLQSCGRGLRAAPGKKHCTIQDHGGHWWRHGSVNLDRDWYLGCNERTIQGTREALLREKKAPEPICCPKCKKIRPSGSVCPQCGYESQRQSRCVIQRDGTLREHTGDIYRPRRTAMKPDTAKIWERMYYRSLRIGRTFRAAEALFVHENHYWPPHTLPLMPKKDIDWFSSTKDVPRDQLT